GPVQRKLRKPWIRTASPPRYHLRGMCRDQLENIRARMRSLCSKKLRPHNGLRRSREFRRAGDPVDPEIFPKGGADPLRRHPEGAFFDRVEARSFAPPDSLNYRVRRRDPASVSPPEADLGTAPRLLLATRPAPDRRALRTAPKESHDL